MFAIQAIEETETTREPVWQDLALCNDGSGGSMTELFLKEDCLDGALTRREPWGVWGGELFVHGKVVAQKRKRGRPPKVRPEIQEQEAQSA